MARLTLPQAAARLGMTRGHLWRLVRAGRIPATRLGRDWTVEADDLRLVAAPAHTGRPRKGTTMDEHTANRLYAGDYVAVAGHLYRINSVRVRGIGAPHYRLSPVGHDRPEPGLTSWLLCSLPTGAQLDAAGVAPPDRDGEPRAVNLIVRVTPDERAALHDAARAAGVTLSGYVRERIGLAGDGR